MPVTKQKLIRHYALHNHPDGFGILRKQAKMHDLYNRNTYNYG